MESTIAGSLLLAIAHLPYAREVVLQLRVQTRLYARLPDEVRDRLPGAPRRAGLVFLGSVRFWIAFRRYIEREIPGEAPEISSAKASLRASSRREKIAGVGGLVVLVALLVAGWRPW